MLYGFAFTKRNISANTLYRISNIDQRTLLWGRSSINRYCEKLIKEQPKYILGLGIYTGRDQQHLRIETLCTNRFRSILIDSSYTTQKHIIIQPFLEPHGMAVFSQDLRHSYCNLISYKIMDLINTHQLQSKYTFIHIPRSFNLDLSVKQINSMVTSAFTVKS